MALPKLLRKVCDYCGGDMRWIGAPHWYKCDDCQKKVRLNSNGATVMETLMDEFVPIMREVA